MIGLNLDDYTLSSSLPESFDITGVLDDYVEVSITLQGECVYSTRLYMNNGSCTFYELRQIVEENMIAWRLPLAAIEISVVYDGSEDLIEDKYIIFSRYRNTAYSDIDFLESHFLVNRTYLTIPRELSANIPFFATANENFSIYYDCVFEKDGIIGQYRLGYSTYHFQRPNIYVIPIGPNTIKTMADNAEDEDCGKLLSFTVRTGSRVMKVFVVDEKPSISFLFLNSYNVTETMFVMGTTSFETKITRKEAVTQDITSFYDKSVLRKWEVETIALTQEEAVWYNEFLESDYVTLNLSQEHNALRILISDINSEISDSSKKSIHIKFSWRFDDNSYWIT